MKVCSAKLELNKKNVGRRPSNAEMEDILGTSWDTLIKNISGDFNFVTDGNITYWVTERTPIQDFTYVGGTRFYKRLIDQDPLFVLSFIRGRGNRARFLEEHAE